MASEGYNGLPVEIDDLSPGNSTDLEGQLSQFRVAWQREIIDNKPPSSTDSSTRSSPVGFLNDKAMFDVVQFSKLSKQDKAKYLFMEGIKAEESGHVHEAVELYRKAVQLVPEVESLIDYREFNTSRKRMESESSLEGSIMDDDEDLDLVMKFQRLHVETKTICQPDWEQRWTHISVLPVEVLVYILKWVVTNDLDMVALENVALVCRGFYLCARDDELWRRACCKIWGVNTGNLKKYGSWRSMFIERPHLRYNGCYISKASYVRHGEKTMDNLYRPWHTVEYFRYIHFFPEGMILMLTSPDDPIKILHKLRHRSARHQGTLKGVYRMTDDKVTAVLKRVKTEFLTSGYSRYKRRHLNVNQNEAEMTFHVEFTVDKAGSRKYSQLVWTHYSVHQQWRTTGEETVTDFDLTNKTYPPLYFSRVKSYTALADRPLQ